MTRLQRRGAEIWEVGVNGDNIREAVIALAVDDEAVADEMIRRYNTHDDLLAVCEAALAFEQEVLDAENQGRPEDYRFPESPIMATLRAAIAAAKGA